MVFRQRDRVHLTRRATLVGSLAALQTPLAATTSDCLSLDIIVSGGRIAARLRGRERAALLTGIGARYLRPFDHSADDRILLVDASDRMMRVTMPRRSFVVWPTGDFKHLVAAWTLPFLAVGGFLGFNGADIEEVSRSNAYLFDLSLGATRLPSVLARSRTTAVYAVFFGEVPSLQSMNDALARVTAAVRAHVDVVAASTVVEHHRPRLLLTVFNDDLGSARSL